MFFVFWISCFLNPLENNCLTKSGSGCQIFIKNFDSAVYCNFYFTLWVYYFILIMVYPVFLIVIWIITIRLFPPPPSPIREWWVRLPYLGESLDLLAKELSKYGNRTGFYSITTIQNLSKLKDLIPLEKNSGVYKLECNCRKLYIGQSGRSIKQRIYEHRLDYRNLAGLKKFPLLLRRKLKKIFLPLRGTFPNQSTKFDDLKCNLLHPARKSNNLNRLEEYETVTAFKTNSRNVLNDLSAIFLNPFTRFIIDY